MDDFDVTKIVIEMVIFYSRRRLQLVLFPFVEVDYSIINRFSYTAILVILLNWLVSMNELRDEKIPSFCISEKEFCFKFYAFNNIKSLS